MNKAINKLMENGYNALTAKEEFNERVNWFLRGTLKTAQDKAYAIKCTIADILEDNIECLDEDMLDITYT